jgi:NADH dehydrogenase
MVMKQAHVVVLGGGVAGLHCVQKLSRGSFTELRITLVDMSDVHVLKADLYEVATAYNKKITDECMVRLKRTVATPLMSLVDPNKVTFLQDTVLGIDPKKKTVRLKKNKNLSYDYLVVALGSVTNFFNVPGIEEHAFPLKTVQDALAVNCHLDQLFHELWKKGKREAIRITIGGGGPTGVEMAGELYSSLRKLCDKYNYPRQKIHVQLIQSGQDLGGMDSKGTERVLARLEELGVCVYRGYRIKKVTATEVLMSDTKNRSKKLQSSMMIWTAGVRVPDIVAKTLGDAKKGGAIMVNSHLQMPQYPTIFAAGDCAFVEDPEHAGTRLPMLAHVAWEEGNFVAANILSALYRVPLQDYKPRREWMILPIGGKYAFFKVGPFLFSGFLAWLLRRLVILRYHNSVMPTARAMHKWWYGGKLFEQND